MMKAIRYGRTNLSKSKSFLCNSEPLLFRILPNLVIKIFLVRFKYNFKYVIAKISVLFVCDNKVSFFCK